MRLSLRAVRIVMFTTLVAPAAGETLADNGVHRFRFL